MGVRGIPILHHSILTVLVMNYCEKDFVNQYGKSSLQEKGE